MVDIFAGPKQLAFDRPNIERSRNAVDVWPLRKTLLVAVTASCILWAAILGLLALLVSGG